ncbi:nicotinate (nicotinamide) nucleotide adenylyltransferase [Helicobacter sp. 13S00477-4]|uniref:nicotinate (nicotinamide) nucleotide adenylyltransferase n=1 Tax=Helicobacter sp. 13S00477-4 TaxID=1905759 RepID=UPI000BA6168F|nr:nicotinate (nicotinamide) nucleotide adenylyltransferase [Helicobacter sp. 13S00477-4]PAF50668.1 nicotinate (nicotinamide) nucleotide adenylyltransferase [Helicobacter sp. 13S00477-4]
MNIAIYGGSFDPPHIAHLKIIEVVLEKLDIDKLIVIVAYQSPFKKPCLFEAQERYDWMKQLTENLSKVEISNMEILQKKPIPSIESVLNIKKKFQPQKIFFIIGEDNLSSLYKWHKYDELKKLVEFILIEREGYQNTSKQNLHTFTLPKITHKISSTQIKQNLSSSKPPKELPKKIKTEVIKSYKELL